MQYQRRTVQPQQVRRKRVFTPKEEEPEASPYYAGHSAGFHPEDTPHVTTADVRAHLPVKQTRPAYEPDELEADQRMTAIQRRYNGIQMPDGVLVPNGNEQWYFHKGPPPQRASRGQTQTTEQVQAVAQKQRRRGRRVHPLLFVGLGLAVMVLGYVALNAFGSWWHTHQDDSTYGRPRTFQIDAVVGHHDSASHPSHFIALNLNSHIILIEIPGGDISRSVIYSGGVLVGDNQDLTPVTLSFQDEPGSIGPALLVHVSDQTITFLNNGTKFVPPSNLVTGGRESSPNLGG